MKTTTRTDDPCASRVPLVRDGECPVNSETLALLHVERRRIHCNSDAGPSRLGQSRPNSFARPYISAVGTALCSLGTIGKTRSPFRCTPEDAEPSHRFPVSPHIGSCRMDCAIRLAGQWIAAAEMELRIVRVAVRP